ncbi:MAG: FAD-dependent oxidoreductase, partial [Pseudomonadota bacterium]
MAGEVAPEGGARPDAGAAARAQAVNRTDMLIVGAGVSGLIMAMEARRRGVRDIAVLEKADEIGGTWRENTYPGVACDIPSHLYSIADRPKADWTRVYSPGAEIQAYLKGVCEAEGLGELIRFGRTLRRAEWDAGARRWRVET